MRKLTFKQVAKGKAGTLSDARAAVSTSTSDAGEHAVVVVIVAEGHFTDDVVGRLAFSREEASAFLARFEAALRRLPAVVAPEAKVDASTDPAILAALVAPSSTSGRKCGECLFNTVSITDLDAEGKCPKCGADYGPEVTP
jgi:hypothetical protein